MFQSGNSQAVRLPNELRLNIEQVVIFRRGDEIVLREGPPEAAGEYYGRIRATLNRSGHPVGDNDWWLAAYTRAEEWILVTSKEREFSRVPDLQVENRVN